MEDVVTAKRVKKYGKKQGKKYTTQKLSVFLVPTI
jgi:hypothetical protein